jgi:molecular chaperone DnaK (HSP70)
MLVDFGGGTTDVTVFKVHQHLESASDFKIEEVEIIGAWGDAALGGEEITNEIAAVLAAKFLGQSTNALRDAREIRKLEDEAEAVKLAVSELQRFHDNGQFDVERVVREATDLLEKSLGYCVLKPDGITGVELHDYLRNYIENERELEVWSNDFPRKSVRIKAEEVVEIFDHKLKKLKSELEPLMGRILQRSGSNVESDSTKPGISAEDSRVDILLLAGQSAQFPTVARVFQNLARQPIDFVRDLDGNPLLKECVSRGSLYYISYLSGGLEFEISGRNRQWTRLGLIVPAFGRPPRFKELIPWGTQYPYESNEFALPRLIAVVAGNTLRLEILENLTMSDDESRQLEAFETFELKLNDASPERYMCKLKVDRLGVVTAFCKVDEDWMEMRPIL